MFFFHIILILTYQTEKEKPETFITEKYISLELFNLKIKYFFLVFSFFFEKQALLLK